MNIEIMGAVEISPPFRLLREAKFVVDFYTANTTLANKLSVLVWYKISTYFLHHKDEEDGTPAESVHPWQVDTI